MKKMLFFEGLLFGCGLLFGLVAFFYLPEEQVQQLQQYFIERLQELSETAVLSTTVGQIFQVNAIDFLRVYLMGICLLGLPLSLLFLFLKGFSFGFSACFLFGQTPILLFSRLLYFPILLFAIGYGSRFTFMLLQNRVSSPIRQLMQYTITFLLLLLVVFFVSCMDGYSCFQYFQKMKIG